MRILLTGAGGFIGRHFAAALAGEDHEVILADRTHGVDFNRMLAIGDWLPLLSCVDAIINCVGIISETRGQSFAVLHHAAPAALFRASAEAGVRHVVQISALGADERAFTPYQLSKRAADDVLRSLPLEWFVLRPSLVYGPGGRSTALFRRLAALPVIPLPGGGRQLVQPVHVDDLTAAVLACLHAPAARRTIDVVGPEAMTFAEWLGHLRSGTRRPAHIVAVPFAWTLTAARLLGYVLPLLHPDNLRMLEHGSTAKVQPLAQLLGRMPRAVP
ncbi:MAG TPA: complex I NDUFA9 subunit family protein [Gammaproteobacteria bacterium]|nr:complex I NDUFA9 subunit family protein [Gammaproteobacteria bacterium]